MPASTARPIDRAARGLVEQREDLAPARGPGNDEVRSHQSHSESPPAALAEETGQEKRRSTDEARIGWTG
jgi:hypothetical protein